MLFQSHTIIMVIQADPYCEFVPIYSLLTDHAGILMLSTTARPKSQPFEHRTMIGD